MQRITLLIVLFILAAHQFWSQRSLSHPTGWMVKADPQQIIFSDPQPSFQFKETLITKVADYKIQARVLSTEKYWLGVMADIAPIDVALGWKEMSDTAIIQQLQINQAGRFYFYSWNDKDLIDPDRIKKTSANMHLISANKYIESQIKSLRVGHIVTLTGQLANVLLKDGQVIKTSLTRDDTGPGACEMMWVTAIQIQD